MQTFHTLLESMGAGMHSSLAIRNDQKRMYAYVDIESGGWKERQLLSYRLCLSLKASEEVVST